MGDTGIEWADKVWNPITGCSPVSPGCANCYARRMAYRLRGRCGYPADDPFRVTFHPERLEEPLRWRKPARIFVNSMGDLFHEDVPVNWLESVLAVMTNCPQHVFIGLTKRANRLRLLTPDRLRISRTDTWPIRNFWLGVTVEDQRAADERVPFLLQVPAAVRLVSIEPMLGPISLDHWFGLKPGNTWAECLCDEIDPKDRPCIVCESRKALGKASGLHWVICGGETGPGARPMHPDWVRSLRDQCVSAGVPFFFKGWGDWMPIHGTGRLRGDEDEEHVPFTWISLDGKLSESGCYPDALMLRVGKKHAGRLLDGQEWNQMPDKLIQGGIGS